jgi:hypothetical protein
MGESGGQRTYGGKWVWTLKLALELQFLSMLLFEIGVR